MVRGSNPRAGTRITWRSQLDLQTLGLLVFGFAWGLGNFGILTWLPTLLGQSSAGQALGSGNVLLFRSALVAVPGTLIATLLYARWRTGATMAVLAIVTSLGIVALGFAISAAHVAVPLVVVLTAVMLIGLNGSSATLSVYSTEVFPTVARATGTGAVAAATKLGGLLGPQVVAYVLNLGAGARARKPLKKAGSDAHGRGAACDSGEQGHRSAP